MASHTGEDAKEIWDRIFQSIFSDDMSVKIAPNKLIYLKQKEHVYFDLRSSATAKTLETINFLIDTPGLTVENWRDFVRSLPIVQQGFLFDRFLYVDEYLSKVGTKEFFYEEKVEDFLRWGLVDIWDARPRENEWQ